jgi:hypothetical protein
VAIEEKAGNDTEFMTNYNTVMPPENDDTGDTEDQIDDHIPYNTKNGKNIELILCGHVLLGGLSCIAFLLPCVLSASAIANDICSFHLVGRALRL